MDRNRLQDGAKGSEVGVGLLDAPAGNGHGKSRTNGSSAPSKFVLVRARLVGVSPLLLDPMTDEVLEGLIDSSKRPQRKTDVSLDEIAANKVIREDGKMGIPSMMLIASLKDAGRQVASGKGKQKISTKQSTTLFSFTNFPDAFLPFDGLDDEGNLPYVVDKRRGVMSSGPKPVAVGIVRPRFDRWGVTAAVELNTAIASAETLRAIFDEAGRNSGIGSFRPNKGGPFGRFQVAEWEVKPLEQ